MSLPGLTTSAKVYADNELLKNATASRAGRERKAHALLHGSTRRRMGATCGQGRGRKALASSAALLGEGPWGSGQAHHYRHRLIWEGGGRGGRVIRGSTHHAG